MQKIDTPDIQICKTYRYIIDTSPRGTIHKSNAILRKKVALQEI